MTTIFGAGLEEKDTFDPVRAFCKRHKIAEVRDPRTLNVFLVGPDGRYTTDASLSSFEHAIDIDTLAFLHGPSEYVVMLTALNADGDEEAIDEISVRVTQQTMRNAIMRNADRLTRELAEYRRGTQQRDDEAWMHAACLSIAEGVPDWNKPTHMDSLAMTKVRELRVKYEEATEALKNVDKMRATIETKAYARGLRAAAAILGPGTPLAQVDAIERAAQEACDVDAVDPEIERLEDTIAAVHEELWDSEHRGQSIVEMAVRVKKERDQARAERDDARAELHAMTKRFLTEPQPLHIERIAADDIRTNLDFETLATMNAYALRFGELLTTRHPATDVDAHRDFDHYSIDKDLRTLRLAIDQGAYPLTLPVFKNIDEWMSRGGKLPKVWREQRSSRAAALTEALKLVAEETTEYAIWVKCMRALEPDAESHPIPKRLMRSSGHGEP